MRTLQRDDEGLKAALLSVLRYLSDTTRGFIGKLEMSDA